MNNPLISVVMPVFNCEAYIKQSIESILNQTYRNFELIIVNDASTDKTLSIVESFNDSRIKIINNQLNLKIAASLNKGIAISNGKYIARMDGDDVSLPDRFELQVKFLEKNTDVDLLGTNISLIDRNGRPQGKLPEVPQHPSNNAFLLSRHCTMAHPTVMFRKASLGEDLFYSDQYPHAEDYELWLRLTSSGYKSSNLKEYLLRYRIHPKSISQINYHQANNSMINAIEKHNPLRLDKEVNDYVAKFIRKPQLIKTDDDLRAVLNIWNESKKVHFIKHNYQHSELVEFLFYERLFFIQVTLFQLINRRKISIIILKNILINQFIAPLPVSIKLLKNIHLYFISKYFISFLNFFKRVKKRGMVDY